MDFAKSVSHQESISHHCEDGFIATYKHLTLRSAFQPIFSRTQDLVGVEALVRIQNNQKTVINPDNFFQSCFVAEEDKSNVERLSRAIHIHNYSISPYKNLKLFLNVLPNASHLVEKTPSANCTFSARLKELNINKKSIVLEIMEVEYENNTLLFTSTEQLSRKGFSIAVDDFGSRASNIERVNLVSPDIIKLDRSLLLAYMENNKEPLLQSIELAKEKKAMTVIEGIENAEQYHAMKNLDIDMHQGFFLGEPHFLSKA